MEGIYYKNGVYLIIDHDAEHENCVYHQRNKDSASLYGGRVAVRRVLADYGYCIIIVDGLELIRLNKSNYGDKELTHNIRYATVVHYLNAIEVNGVDAFMQHYKQSIDFLHDELMKMKEKTELDLSSTEDSSLKDDIQSKLNRIKDMLFKVLCILFTFHTFISAGLENDKVISVYQSIMETIA